MKKTPMVLCIILSLICFFALTSCQHEHDPYSSYRVGRIGPAGGFIFYDCDADNKSGNADGLISAECGWRFLEADKFDLKTVDGVPVARVSSFDDYKSSFIFGYYKITANGKTLFVNGTTHYSSSDCTREEIGAGKQNTQLLVSAMGETNAYGTSNNQTDVYAARLCDLYSKEYDGVVYDDWFLPSEDELLLMYNNLYLNGIGNFADCYEYWSSTESHSWTIDSDPTEKASRVYFSRTTSYVYGDVDRSYKYKVRPIRAF